MVTSFSSGSSTGFSSFSNSTTGRLTSGSTQFDSSSISTFNDPLSSSSNFNNTTGETVVNSNRVNTTGTSGNSASGNNLTNNLTDNLTNNRPGSTAQPQTNFFSTGSLANAGLGNSIGRSGNAGFGNSTGNSAGNTFRNSSFGSSNLGGTSNRGGGSFGGSFGSGSFGGNFGSGTGIDLSGLIDLSNFRGNINQLFAPGALGGNGGSTGRTNRRQIPIAGSAENDVLIGANRSEILVGDRGNDVMQGRGGADTLLGGRGDDQLSGGLGSDRLSGDGGNNALFGGANRDIFSLQRGNGVTVIQDFQPGQDQIQLPSNLEFRSLGIQQQGADAVLRAGADVLAVVANTQVDRLSASRFV
jgi:Ca2+-binding RTX toxin-like protein